MNRYFFVSFVVGFVVFLSLLVLLGGCTQSPPRPVQVQNADGSDTILERSYDPETGVYCYQHKKSFTLSCVKVHEVPSK
jgi:hypothetical protein